MSNIVPESPYDSATTYLSSCPPENMLSGGMAPPSFPNASETLDVAVQTDGTVKIKKEINGTTTYFSFGTGSGEICFDPALRYNARLYANSSGTSSCEGSSCYEPSGYLDAVYTGNYLNWYFGTDASGYTSAANFGAGARRKPNTSIRMEVAKNAANAFIDWMPAGGVRLGFSTYNGSDGGSLREVMGDLDSSKRSSVKSKVDGLNPSGSTPLAETLSDIGRYFATGHTGNLTLHPDSGSPSTASVANVFDSHAFQNDSGQTIASPIQYACQKSFAVLISDGRPQSDRNISSLLQDYDGDCSGDNAGNCGSYDQKNDRIYESSGSDYLDDVAQGLYEIDLRPDIAKTGDQKNNVLTYTIGFADEQVINDPLMQDTATQSGGLFLSAENTSDLVTALQNAFADIIDKTSSASSAATNTTSLISGSEIYQARFNSVDWSGQLLSFDIDVLGSISNTPNWDAGEVINTQSASSRQIITYNQDSSDGMPFRWSDICPGDPTCSGDQADFLNQDAFGVNDGRGSDRVSYLRGNPIADFRSRTSKLGDIVHSTPFFVGAPLAGYVDSSYASFATTHASRDPILYVGANDGMLHGFNATTGEEAIAYVPGPVYPNLSKLTDPAYGDSLSHHYFVDGSPMVADAQISDSWKTVLAGGLNHGGQGFYALDVTDPSNFTEANAASLVLWEFTDEDDADLGYTYNQPPLDFLSKQSAQIAKMNNDKWALIVGNGYNNTEDDDEDSTTANDSTTGHAVLYILFLEGGTDGDWTDTGDFIKIDTGVGSTATPNGLATPMPVDADADGDIDIAYAGDLEGNLWKFDLTDSDPANWAVATTVSGSSQVPLFTAVDSSNTPQPITTAPIVVPHPQGGFMVGFGTGKYLEQSDLTTTDTQTLYGIWDSEPMGEVQNVSGRSKLVDQEVLGEVIVSGESYRVTSNKTVEYTRASNGTASNSSDRGWYMDLPTTGERVAFNPLARTRRSVFVTLIPNSTDPCAVGGSGWIMELDYLSGSRLSVPPFDITGDKKITDADKVDFDTDGDGSNETVPPSGKKPDIGIPTTPTVVDKDRESEVKVISGSSGAVETLMEGKSVKTGRLSWRQIIGD
ncbi:MAG: pilus assembly protein [Methylohalobius sp. ZOD2]